MDRWNWSRIGGTVLAVLALSMVAPFVLSKTRKTDCPCGPACQCSPCTCNEPTLVLHADFQPIDDPVPTPPPAPRQDPPPPRVGNSCNGGFGGPQPGSCFGGSGSGADLGSCFGGSGGSGRGFLLPGRERRVERRSARQASRQPSCDFVPQPPPEQFSFAPVPFQAAPQATQSPPVAARAPRLLGFRNVCRGQFCYQEPVYGF
jgi:hypothetical protein